MISVTTCVALMVISSFVGAFFGSMLDDFIRNRK